MTKELPLDAITYVNGSYRTGTVKRSLLGRLLPAIRLYSRAISIVVRGSAKAKRGQYVTADWVASSLETLRALEEIGVAFEISGVENFRNLDTPCVFIGNHMSTLETMVLPAIISQFKDSTFVVKQSLVDYPVFKHIMRSRDPITVGRTNPREDLKAVFEGGEVRLKAGRSIVIFPQTTRTEVFNPSEFNTIGIKLAKRAGVPVMPIALKTDAWGNGRYLKDFGRIDPSKKVWFEFGKPMTIAGRGDEEHQQIIDFISGKLKEWGGKVAEKA
ncbi:MAG: 1-acyl-sn-glycerol-3-phosphate acyltransferase [Nitrospirae bacterium]|nr:1-acyl-sn-glycerol-3-phosphate acyltransferase [Nitrospirota bacterium]